MKYLPDWTIQIDEISNGVFKVTFKDSCGRLAEVTDGAIDKTIERAVGEAFDIERQTSKNWNLFLYDLAQLLLVECKITSKEYNDRAFGSWLIELNSGNRIVYDGKDRLLIYQGGRNFEWIDHSIVKGNELTYSDFANLVTKACE